MSGGHETALEASQEELAARVVALEENARVTGRVAAEDSRAASEAAGVALRAEAKEPGTTLG